MYSNEYLNIICLTVVSKLPKQDAFTLKMPSEMYISIKCYISVLNETKCVEATAVCKHDTSYFHCILKILLYFGLMSK